MNKALEYVDGFIFDLDNGHLKFDNDERSRISYKQDAINLGGKIRESLG